jgi:hypothetical protein
MVTSVAKARGGTRNCPTNSRFLSKPTDMTIHWIALRALSDGAISFFDSTIFWGIIHFLNFSQNNLSHYRVKPLYCTVLFRSLTDMASARLETREMADLVKHLIESTGDKERGHIRFEEFKMLFQEQINRFGSLSFDWKGFGKGESCTGCRTAGPTEGSKSNNICMITRAT